MMNRSSSENASATLARLLHLLDAPVTKTTIEQTLERHPEFPALSSLSDALKQWRIDNISLRLGSVEQLREVPLPCIAHLRQQGGWFRLVTALQGDSLIYWDSATGQGQQSLNQFEQDWDGVVLVAEPDGQSGESNYTANYRKELLARLRGPALWAISVLIVLMGAALLPTLTLIHSGWLLTKIVGLALSLALLTKQFGAQSTFIDRLCRVGTKTSCQSLLDSPGAKLWGWLGWAEVGTLYFTATLLTLLAGPNPLLSWLAVLALPYTVFSVYYQARIARTWCPLCLGVQGVLLAEAGLAGADDLSLEQLVNMPAGAMLTLLLSGALAVGGWLLLRPLLVVAQQQPKEHEELLAFKRNATVFGQLLAAEDPMPALPETLRPLWLGQPDAPHVLTVVTNPYCGPCAKKHQEVQRLLAKAPNVAVRLVFMASEVEDDKVTQLARHLLALAPEEVIEALDAWFAQDKHHYAAWASQHPLPTNTAPARDMALEHAHWCWEAGIHSTPTVFLNGHRFPDLYRVDEVAWLLQTPTPIATFA